MRARVVDCDVDDYNVLDAPVAQLDRASGFEPEGREFESLRARQFSRTKKALQKISAAQLLPSSRIPYFFGFKSAW